MLKGGTFDRLIILEEKRPGALPTTRIQGQLDGLQQVIGAICAARALGREDDVVIVGQGADRIVRKEISEIGLDFPSYWGIMAA